VDSLPWSCSKVVGDALNGDSYRRFVEGADTFIQLVGVAHPSPAKAQQFRDVDRQAALEAIRIASFAGVEHFIYLSVAQPAPLMRSYIEVRAECERALLESGLCATIFRPWYVLGPGHRWPYCLVPLYRLLELLPASRDGARRLGLVHITQMISAMVQTVDSPCRGHRVVDVPQIRMLAARRDGALKEAGVN
jgi:uncharacterized protein YbjT (DUF2867 family)